LHNERKRERGGGGRQKGDSVIAMCVCSTIRIFKDNLKLYEMTWPLENTK